MQRVVVKVHIARHHSPQKGRASLRRHISYLTRESVTRDADSGRFYDASRDGIDAKKETKTWRDDRHHFRLIVGVENAHAIGDLKPFVRDLVDRMQRDLGALTWFAVDHRNTDNPHTHLLIRGRGEDGRDLVIPREYIAHRIREHAQSIATAWLGERSVAEAQNALAGEVQVTANVYDSISGRHLLVPQGTRIIGRYNSEVLNGQDRVLIAWQRLILPNGFSINLEAMPGTDATGVSGMADRVDFHGTQLAGATLLSTLVALSGNFAATTTREQEEVGTVANTVAQQASRVAQRIIDRQLNVKPTILVRAGMPLNVLVNRDLPLMPYRGINQGS